MSALPSRGGAMSSARAAGSLPGFFVLGAQKAGTTSLDAWLRLQRGLALPNPKETHFLSDDERHAKGLAWYLARFPAERGASARLRGEVDPDYLGDARVPARMARLYARAPTPPRLVVVLREPIERAFSQWRMTRRRGLEARPFAEALHQSWLADKKESGGGAAGHHDYYARGCYARHLARFRAALPGAPLLVLRFEDSIARERRAQTFTRLCAFLGLAGEPVLPDFDVARNAAGGVRSRLFERFLQRRGGVRRALGRLVPSQDLRLRLGVLLERANRVPQRSDEPGQPGAPLESPVGGLPAEVLRALRADLDELARDLGWDFTTWQAGLDRFERGGA